MYALLSARRSAIYSVSEHIERACVRRVRMFCHCSDNPCEEKINMLMCRLGSGFFKRTRIAAAATTT